ncbi:hypothetical protein K402DRAFT_464258 [Aulographum hederae CBS 113979]|uniref:Uncharacterized protein n=1 Tax=Aulographum hederae CBS 113979 TaxID=1176131 RepID=A0A6G1GXP6_9PEZI|nr:hypothetical protein K402DRAFT_464258 [Aulographum hederae CBS 113979]
MGMPPQNPYGNFAPMNPYAYTVPPQTTQYYPSNAKPTTGQQFYPSTSATGAPPGVLTAPLMGLGGGMGGMGGMGGLPVMNGLLNFPTTGATTTSGTTTTAPGLNMLGPFANPPIQTDPMGRQTMVGAVDGTRSDDKSPDRSSDGSLNDRFGGMTVAVGANGAQNGTHSNGTAPNGTPGLVNGSGGVVAAANGRVNGVNGVNGLSSDPCLANVNGTNGVNGHGPHGHGVNGNGVNGNGVNGHGVNGNGVNGHGANGTTANGTAANGRGVNGDGVSTLSEESARARVFRRTTFPKIIPRIRGGGDDSDADDSGASTSVCPPTSSARQNSTDSSFHSPITSPTVVHHKPASILPPPPVTPAKPAIQRSTPEAGPSSHRLKALAPGLFSVVPTAAASAESGHSLHRYDSPISVAIDTATKNVFPGSNSDDFRYGGGSAASPTSFPIRLNATTTTSSHPTFAEILTNPPTPPQDSIFYRPIAIRLPITPSPLSTANHPKFNSGSWSNLHAIPALPPNVTSKSIAPTLPSIEDDEPSGEEAWSALLGIPAPTPDITTKPIAPIISSISSDVQRGENTWSALLSTAAPAPDVTSKPPAPILHCVTVAATAAATAPDRALPLLYGFSQTERRRLRRGRPEVMTKEMAPVSPRMGGGKVIMRLPGRGGRGGKGKSGGGLLGGGVGDGVGDETGSGSGSDEKAFVRDTSVGEVTAPRKHVEPRRRDSGHDSSGFAMEPDAARADAGSGHDSSYGNGGSGRDSVHGVLVRRDSAMGTITSAGGDMMGSEDSSEYGNTRMDKATGFASRVDHEGTELEHGKGKRDDGGRSSEMRGTGWFEEW